MISRRSVLAAATAAVALGAFGPAQAGWQEKYPELNLGVITSENEADRTARYAPVQAYLEKALGVKINWRVATDYAGIIEGVKAGKIDIARFGPASYSQAYIVTNGEVQPLAAELDNKGIFGYHSVVVVKKDSPYQKLEDLKGKTLAFADPNSTSGHQAPRYFMGESGVDVDKLFGATPFSGSHENSVMGLVNGTFDAAVTWWRSEEYSNPPRMEEKKMIEPGQWRIIWKSPKLPNSPWAMSAKLPQEMRNDLQKALIAMPEAWKSLTDGKASALIPVTHKDYEAIVRMIQHNLKQRCSS
jgi:phosphonate transport system substrate-binding protein